MLDLFAVLRLISLQLKIGTINSKVEQTAVLSENTIKPDLLSSGHFCITKAHTCKKKEFLIKVWLEDWMIKKCNTFSGWQPHQVV